MADAVIDVVGPDELPSDRRPVQPDLPPGEDGRSRSAAGTWAGTTSCNWSPGSGTKPVGFFLGFELKPDTFFAWFYGVLPRLPAVGDRVAADGGGPELGGPARVRDDPAGVPQPAPPDAAPGDRARATTSSACAGTPDRGENLVIFEKTLNAA